MRHGSDLCQKGISPVISIILIVAITIILAGVVSVFVISYANRTSEEAENYLFTADMDASDDTIEITMMSGSSHLNTSRMRIIIDGTTISNIPEVVLRSGELFTVDAGFDVEPGRVYNLRIVINNRMMYEGFPVADP